MAKITHIWSREILDSRAVPTLETALRLDTGYIAVASVPSGASTGKLEAIELRDNDPTKFGGKGVLKAVANVNEKIAPALVNMDATNQKQIDQKLKELDGTDNKRVIGANATLSVSLAVTKAGAQANGMPLYKWIHQLATNMQITDSNPPTRIPTPVFNMINGGLHGAGNLDFQEFQVIPASSKPYNLALRGAVEVYNQVRESLIRRNAIHSVGDEGGFAPNLFTNADALAIYVEAIRESNYQIGQDFFLGLDISASNIHKNGTYSIKDKPGGLNTVSLISFYESIYEEYRLTYLEDGVYEEDWDGWKQLTKNLGDKMLIVGDDLLVTNPDRVKKAIQEKACNSILVKPNQIGTITETLEVVKLARDAGWKTIVSHRSGETNDSAIADFAVGIKSDFVKFGAPARGERVAKYNRLLSIEAETAQKS